MSTLKADTIQSTSGGAATLTKQQAVKTHNRYNFDGSTVTGSFNQSGVSDLGSGEYQATYTNNMSDATYTVMMSVGIDDGTENQYVFAVGTRRSVLPTSSTVNVQSAAESGNGSAGNDADLVMHSCLGDLA